MNGKHDLHARRGDPQAPASSRPDLSSSPAAPVGRTASHRLLDEWELNLPSGVRIKESHASYDCGGIDVEILLEEDARIRIAAHIGTPRPADELKLFHGLLAHQLELMTPAFVVMGWDRACAGFYAISHHYPGDQEVQLEPFVAHLEHCVNTARILRNLHLPDFNGGDSEASLSSKQPVKPSTARVLR
jgi:hypothetical protein